MKQQSKTFCVLPWMHASTTASGNFRVCCYSISAKSFIFKSDGSVYKIHKDNLKEVWHSETYKKIRQAMLDGKQLSMCERCFREEDTNVESLRQKMNKKWSQGGHTVHFKTVTPPVSNIKYLDLRLGNTCNLRCRMCSPYSSNQMLKEWKGLCRQISLSSVHPITDDSQIMKIKYQWPNQVDFEKLIYSMPSLNQIYLTGGEPLIIDRQYDLLRLLIKKKLSKNITLKYNTNLTKVPTCLFELWKSFKHVFLKVSIDGFGELNNYIRYPSQWEMLEKNLKRIRQFKKTNNNLRVVIDCTVQMYNIIDLNQLLLWGKANNLEICFNLLDQPECLNIRVLPRELKHKVTNNLSSFKNDFFVQEIIDYMNKEDWSDSYLEEFFKYTDFLDKSRGQKMKNYLPDLIDYKDHTYK